MAPGQWSCSMTPNGMMTPSGIMTPTCQPNNFSTASTAVPSGAQSPQYCEDDSDAEDDGDARAEPHPDCISRNKIESSLHAACQNLFCDSKFLLWSLCSKGHDVFTFSRSLFVSDRIRLC